MKKRYLKLIQEDNKLHEIIKTPEGQAAYWEELKLQVLESDLAGLLEHSLGVSGHIIECGVWRGRSIKLMSHVIKSHASRKRVFACDSFEGFGENVLTTTDVKLFRPMNRLKRKFTAASDVPEKLGEFFKLYEVDGVCVQGFFKESLPTLDPKNKYCFAHIDCDAYTSHHDCLEYIYPRITSGGCIVFDDYGSRAWPGAKKAVDEFFSDKPEKPQYKYTRKYPAWHIIKE